MDKKNLKKKNKIINYQLKNNLIDTPKIEPIDKTINSIITGIVFYHFHVNGDCYNSKILVKHIIENTKNNNLIFYYNSTRSLNSHCKDIGITNDNFNSFNLPELTKNICIIDNLLYINVWIGNVKNDILCWCCLKNIINHYNELIQEINNLDIFKIPYIENNRDPYVGFDYSLYNVNFLNEYIIKKKSIFKKIIIIYNNKTQTYLHLNNINHDIYIDYLSNKYEDYLFITFLKVSIEKNNIISFNEIYVENNLILPVEYAIQFAYVVSLCDKVIGLSSGPFTLLFNSTNKNVKDKFIMITENINNAPMCIENINNIQCLEKYDYYINSYIYYDINKLIINLENHLLS
jgi:hypothetical protein